ncbi:MAG: hypothetical protein RMJ33_14275 [Saprospiraceae bacterium]|nr:hypothetical protein [Saprospiraceae bacterium]MDW8230997.1 hypothetical protein [Saprospiraceae bacterium]
MTKRPRPLKSAFAKAVHDTPSIAECYQRGLQALGSDSDKVSPKNSRHCQGSVSLDACLQAAFPNDNHWDYALGYAGKAYFVEVHPAIPREVKTVLKKLEWLKGWLRKEAPKLENLKADSAFHWIASGNVGTLSTSREYRQAAQAGVAPKSKLQLP